MDSLYLLKESLEHSVKKNGEKPLTNKWLLNLINISINSGEKHDRDEWIGHGHEV